MAAIDRALTLALSSAGPIHPAAGIRSSPARVRLQHRNSKSLLLMAASKLGGATAAAAAPPVEEAVHDTEVEHKAEALPELLTEYMVDMKCDGCVKSVKSKLEQVEGVKSIAVDLPNQVVRVLGTAPVKSISAALEETGRRTRLIGQGSIEDFGISAAVVEFKGPQIHGVVRFAQVSMELARVEATFTGLTPGVHAWTINSYGDLTRGAASTGEVFNPHSEEQALGDLGCITADETGRGEFSGTKKQLRVAELIGRALVVYRNEDKSVHGITAAVIARSAGVGENYKKLCSCDGTVIWES